MKFCLLASGSSGNCGYVKSGDTEILVDAGISVSRIKNELTALGTDPKNISALFITHEHGDHTSQIVRVAHHLDCPVFITERTMACIPHMWQKHLEIRHFSVPECIEWGEFAIQPFHVYHDAVEPCGFVFRGIGEHTNEPVALGYATDVGRVSRSLMRALSACRGIVIESNHDTKMLLDGPYPYLLKTRISSPTGHLSNQDAAQLVCSLVEKGNLKVALLAHLSQENNRPDLAIDTVKLHLNGLFNCEVLASFPDRPSKLISL